MRRWWRRLGTANKIAVIGLIVAILGLVPGYLAFFPTNQKSPTPTPSPSSEVTSPPAPLQLVSFRVASGVDVDTLVSDFEGPDEKQKVKVASLIDLTIKNVSDDSLVLTDAVFEVAGQPLKECKVAGGPLSLTGLYDVVLPASPAQPSSVIRKQLTHEINPHDAERLAFKIGPRTIAEGQFPLLYHVQVSLQHDSASQPIRIGAAVVVTPTIEAYEWFFSNYPGEAPMSDECVLSNARLVQEFAKRPGAKSSDFERLLKLTKAADAKGGALEGKLPSAPSG
jgi:hypothetical protein